MSGGLMDGKRGLVMGVANDKSIAWGIAQACHEQGAGLAFTYQGEALGKRVQPLAASVGCDIVLPCDVTDAASLDSVFATLAERWGGLDFLVHAIGFSDKNELRGSYTAMTTPANFTQTMLVSVYSFTAAAQRAEKLMPNGGSLLTLTYYGAEKVMP
ncbi:MAG TPA: SDR family oxidoreductase, partial [Amaricoccus sp.]|nr:SDR family oxidoreductase [Amaricoccus sp.]